MSDNHRPLNGHALELHLKKHGVIPTPQRLEIAEVLFRRAQHMSADQIMAAVNRGEKAKVSKATVYNTLKLFSDKGLVREVIVDPARVFYDSTTGSHHHIYNVDSGELQDIPSHEVAFSKLPTLPSGMQPDGIEVIMRVRKRRD
ncbi:MAG TPA: transcriptional repressor [Gammaproteobacteria bacterium]|jgi:Fur family iron response transcriptional regulator|nr:transcriptional repressor [Gammaproteobacteria bacterium]